MAGRCRQTPTMRFDYRSTNRQSHSHPVGFRRKECVENALQVAWINPCARVFQHDLHVMGFVHFRLYSQNSFATSDRTHCIDGVHDQVNEHLLQLHPELSPKVGDVGNREGGISWGCLTPPLLHRRSDMPCPRITSCWVYYFSLVSVFKNST